MASSSYYSRSRQDHHSSHSQCWSVPYWIDGNIALNFMRGSPCRYTTPFCPYPRTKLAISESVGVCTVASKPEVYMIHKSPKCSGNDWFRLVQRPMDTIFTVLWFPLQGFRFLNSQWRTPTPTLQQYKWVWDNICVELYVPWIIVHFMSQSLSCVGSDTSNIPFRKGQTN